MRQPIRSKARPEDTRWTNRALVLQSIYNDELLSRADIARATGLTKVTVSDLVAELIAAKLVGESGTSETTRPGKPGTQLNLIPDSHDILAMDLAEATHFTGAIVSLRGEVKTSFVSELNGAVGQAALDVAKELARELVSKASNPILGLGVGTPGTVDDRGVVLSAPNLHWDNLPLQKILHEELGIPVRVENDGNAAVLAERRFAGSPDDLIRIGISRGVGAGLLVGGVLVHGPGYDAGELGHVVIDENGDKCSCGKIGCLETCISVPALSARIEADPTRRAEILAEAGHRLGLALSPVVGMLGSQHVVVGGPSDLVTEEFLAATRNCVDERTRSDFRPHLNLTASPLGDQAILQGASALVLFRQLGVS